MDDIILFWIEVAIGAQKKFKVSFLKFGLGSKKIISYRQKDNGRGWNVYQILRKII